MPTGRTALHRTELARFRVVCALWLLVGSSPGCGTQSSQGETDANAAAGAPSVLYTDATRELSIDFIHKVGEGSSPYFMPRAVGSGAALFDFDDDGRLDLYLLQNGGPASGAVNKLFRQGSDGRFADVTVGSGLDVDGWGMGVAVGDVNNDGRVDVLLTEYGRVRLFLNQSGGPVPRFVDISAAAGIESPLWATSAAMFDFDRDGWLDVVVANYVEYSPSRSCLDPKSRREFCGPDNFPGRMARLYRNRGQGSGVEGQGSDKNINKDPRGKDSPNLSPQPRAPSPQPPATFEDVTIASGLIHKPGPGLGVFSADFDGDHWPDILIANDGKPNHLWINQRNGTFTEEGALRGIAYNALGVPEANMGIAIGDVDGDAQFDIYVTHLTTETNRLWKQQPRGFFHDQTAAAGLGDTMWRATGFGTVMADFDNSGTLDLALCNGRVERGHAKPQRPAAGLDSFWVDYAERNQLLVNDGAGKFRDVSPQNDPFCGEAAVARGLACGDVDNDGGMDLIVTYITGSVRVFRNVAAHRGHWLLVRAVDPALKRDAYGAEVYLRVGEQQLLRWINPGYSYLCSNDPRAHFGLGTADKYDAIEIRWPDGIAETFPGGPADRLVTLRKGEGRVVSSQK